MLILKCTQKAAKELGVKRANLPEIPAKSNTTLLGDWFVNQIKFGHTKTLLFANAITLYSILVEYKKKDLVDVAQLFSTNLKSSLQLEGFASKKINPVLADYTEVTLAKSDSRSVLGSMNDLVVLYEAYIYNRGGIKAVELTHISWEVNRTPQLKRGGHYSINILKHYLPEKEG